MILLFARCWFWQSMAQGNTRTVINTHYRFKQVRHCCNYNVSRSQTTLSFNSTWKPHPQTLKSTFRQHWPKNETHLGGLFPVFYVQGGFDWLMKSRKRRTPHMQTLWKKRSPTRSAAWSLEPPGAAWQGSPASLSRGWDQFAGRGSSWNTSRVSFRRSQTWAARTDAACRLLLSYYWGSCWWVTRSRPPPKKSSPPSLPLHNDLGRAQGLVQVDPRSQKCGASHSQGIIIEVCFIGYFRTAFHKFPY